MTRGVGAVGGVPVVLGGGIQNNDHSSIDTLPSPDLNASQNVIAVDHTCNVFYCRLLSYFYVLFILLTKKNT